MYYLYILKGSSKPSFYIGFTSDLKKRVQEHNQGCNSSTKRGITWNLVYYEAFLTENKARDRERKLKQRGRAWQELKRRFEDSA